MIDTAIKPSRLEHLYFMSAGTGAWQHFNYYLQNYTDYPLLKSRNDVNSKSSVSCGVWKEEIVKVLARDLFDFNSLSDFK